jgi:hypothetical protein
MSAPQVSAGQERGPPGLNLERKKSGTGKGSRRSGRGSKKLQRDPEKRTYSFSPGRNDSIRVPKDIHRTHPVPPIPANVEKMPGGTQEVEKEWRRVPTLHKRSAQDLPRRKSSKKRKEDHDREAEIKAMSASMPIRATTEHGFAGRPTKKESKKMREGFGRSLTTRSSAMSLPSVDSAHSSMSSNADNHASYELKGIDLFSPRPTIRYSQNPLITAATSTASPDSPPRKLPDRENITSTLLKANKRIDDIADDLDAGSLRELMERDQRRKERKKIADREKIERKLARKAEKQRIAEEEAERNDAPPPKNLDRGIVGRELVGLGIEGETSSPKRKASDASSRRRGKRPAEVDPSRSATSVQNPFSDFQRSDSLPPTEPSSPVDEGDEMIIGTAKVARLSKASMSPPTSPEGHARGPSNISEVIDLPKPVPAAEKPAMDRRSSDSVPRQHQSWTSFFRRGPKEKRNSIPTSFSNTSRDSTSTPLPLPANLSNRPSFSSGVPKRTLSRFREDLPELPLSPPDSRLQSPEADVVPPIRSGYPEKRGGGRGSGENPHLDTSLRRHDTPTSGYRSLDQPARTRNETPTSGVRSDIPSPEPSAIMSQSLASIDSEGSWLSGRPRAGSKRSSAQAPHHPLRDSHSSLQKRYGEYSGSMEELGIAEDEYFSRLTPEPNLGEMSKRRASGYPVPSSDEEDGDGDSITNTIGSTKWGAVARQPTVVHHELRAKSREVLLNDYENDSPKTASPIEKAEETPRDSSYSFEDNNKPLPEDPTIGRASSVNLSKGHMRHISAGSARLVDLKPRASGEGRRPNAGPSSGS